MGIFEELLAIDWPDEFIIEYADGTKERLHRGDGVALTPPTDDPKGLGGLSANLPKTHLHIQKQCGRHVRLNDLLAIYSTDGQRLWPSASQRAAVLDD
jgi:hypothetical protein